MKIYDFLIVGAGFFGSVFAREMTDRGAKCLVIDKRGHIAGNCYTEKNNGIDVHKYGPHIFHTNNQKIWNYINKHAEFNSFTYRPKVNYNNKIFSFPINLLTLHQLWGVSTPLEAKNKLDSVKINIENPKNLEEWALSQVGEEVYKTFFYGYTKKQWGREPKELPSFIIKRLPIRLSYNDNYFNDKYQGIPVNGYTDIFRSLLSGIDLELEADYLSNREYFDKLTNKVIYTGAIDEFYDYELGTLEWRSLRFEENIMDVSDYQGVAAVNYTDSINMFTRIIEHKHFMMNSLDSKSTIVTREYPQAWNKSKERFYPVNDKANNELFLRYKNHSTCDRIVFGGRLGDYKYYDMHQVIASALYKSSKEEK